MAPAIVADFTRALDRALFQLRRDGEKRAPRAARELLVAARRFTARANGFLAAAARNRALTPARRKAIATKASRAAAKVRRLKARAA